MIIEIGKTKKIPIEVTDEDLLVFKQMHHMDMDGVDIEIYLWAWFHQPIDQIIMENSVETLTKIAHDGLVSEAKDCYGNENYELMKLGKYR